MKICNKFESREARLAVIGLGYVGLPLAMEYTKQGFEVVGIDLMREKVGQLNRGESYIIDVPSADVQSALATGRFKATTEAADLATCDSVNICVPTPLGKTQDPDMTYIQSAVDAIVPHLHRGMLVILESTTYPGTCEEVILPRLAETGLIVGEDFYLAFSPERVDPGNPVYHTRNIPKVVGGVTPDCTAAAACLYGQVMDAVVPVSTARVAETVKLLENTYRSVNIGLVNEIALLCNSMDIDVWEVIEAASTKPFGFMPFYPGPGLGGHCIPIDPFYFSWKAKQVGMEARFIELAGHVNGSMPRHVVNLVADALNEVMRSIKGSRILVVGVAYKPDIDDVRESPALDIMEMLHKRGGEVWWHDPHVEALSGLTGIRKLDTWSVAALDGFDAAVIVTPHRGVDHGLLLEAGPMIIDTRNALKGRRSDKLVRL
ncbi:nucleotide sugar dehydrogenase [bacterium]|nr:nucleotide sugar dehydrogenase [bacterium]MBU1074177.1 nucleotide sugar dehydrogenase [bacterium]